MDIITIINTNLYKTETLWLKLYWNNNATPK